MQRIEEEGKFTYYPLENLKNKLKRFKRMMMIIIMNCFCGMVDLFLAGTTVRYSHHRKSLTRCNQDLDLCRT